MTETDEQRKTRLLISYAWQLVSNAQQRIEDLSADSQDDLYEYHDHERAQLQQWLEFATQAAEELERLQAENVKLHRPADEALLHLESMARELAARPEPAEISVWYDGEMYWAEASAMDGWAGHAGSACELLLGMPGGRVGE